MWIGLFPSSARSVRFANGHFSFLHPRLRPSCDPFEVLTLGGSSLSLAAVANDPLDLSPGWGIHERVEGEILLDESSSQEGARGLPENRHRREVLPSFAAAGKSFLEFLEAQTVRKASPPLPSLAHRVREENVHQGEQELRVLFRGARHGEGNGERGLSARRPGLATRRSQGFSIGVRTR